MPTRPPGTPDIDLTFDNTFGLLNGAVFMTGLDQSAGTGTFNSFVQIQHAGTEQGYNTDATAQYDERSALNHNHSVLLADIPIVFGDAADLAGRSRQPHQLHARHGICRRAHQLSRLQSRCRRQSLDRA